MDNIKQLSDLYPLMMDELPGINTPILDQHLQQASRKFCDDSEAFVEELSPINLVADQSAYTIQPSWDCRIKKIKQVWIRTSDDVTNDYPGTLQEECLYEFGKPNRLILAENITPGTAVTDGLVVHVILVPEITQTGNNVLSTEFLNDYSEAIMARAYYTLLRMPKQRWSDPERAMMYLNEYNDYVTKAIGETTLAGKMQPSGFEG